MYYIILQLQCLWPTNLIHFLDLNVIVVEIYIHVLRTSCTFVVWNDVKTVVWSVKYNIDDLSVLDSVFENKDGERI